MSLTLCPICAVVCKDHIQTTPYWVCPNCDVWFQDPAPPKVYHGAHEGPPEVMSDADKAANEGLADWLFREPMRGIPGATLDIGAAYPYLASRLRERGCDAAAVDGEPVPNDLGIPYFAHDFEGNGQPEKNDHLLVTCIHSFEHFYRPVEALRKIRELVADDGRLFIRCPDHKVQGIDRDLTPGHYTIHPFVHTLSSILQICVEAKDAFEVESYQQLQPGQADIVLRPVKEEPEIQVGMIVKNEERDLPRALRSMEKVLSESSGGFVIVDTGSIDRTAQIAEEFGAEVQVFTGASTQDADGDWKLQDFSAARNRVLEVCESHNRGWYMWIDADDVLITRDAIRRAMYWPQKDCFALWIESGSSRWLQHRMWKLDRGVRFKGRCHEYPIIDDLAIGQLDDSLIVHHPDPHPGETSNARNLRMLLMEWDEAPTPRGAFYIANTHRDAGRNKEAAEWYAKRISMGEGFRDEWLFSILYLARAYRAVNCLECAAGAAGRGAKAAPDWMEFRMEQAFILYAQQRYERAIEMAAPALDAPVTPTVLWRETAMYCDQPARLISWCHEHLGVMGQALDWAKQAKERIGAPDADWDARILRLEQASLTQTAAIISARRQVICVRRPGAIGDVMMTLNVLPELKRENPGREVWYFTDKSLSGDDALGWLIRAAGADQVMDSSTFEAWGRKSARLIDFVGYPLAEGYPDKPMAKHLLQYFAQEAGVAAHGTMPCLAVRRPARPQDAPAGPYATLQAHAGWSKYKEWPEELWDAVLADLPFPVVRIEAAQGRSLRHSIAMIANATLHLGIDSFGNHLTHYRWEDEDGTASHVPGVILWGSTQPSAAGYVHNTNIGLGLPCQPCFRENPAISRMGRGPCINPPRPDYEDSTPHACMAGITVEQVAQAVREAWKLGQR